jgi:NAD(P)-dependent dehydrogenase (short-subunit alcohol dehydrogenase family)
MGRRLQLPQTPHEMTKRLKGKVAFITGAGTGIGRVSARLFADEGAQVVVAEFNVDAGKETVAHIEAAGGTAMFVETDVRQAESVRGAIDQAGSIFGGLDILYNNAGGSMAKDNQITRVSDETFWNTMQLDLFGTWLCCRYGIPELMKRGGGCIVNTASIVALFGNPGKDAYTAAKGGVVALTRSMAVEYAAHNIRVNALAPGATQTERVKGYIAQNLVGRDILDRHLLGLPEPHHISQTALFLASDEAAMITGQVLAVDSGISIG